MTSVEQQMYREAAECRVSIRTALKVIRDRYARGELVVLEKKKGGR